MIHHPSYINRRWVLPDWEDTAHTGDIRGRKVDFSAFEKYLSYNFNWKGHEWASMQAGIGSKNLQATDSAAFTMPQVYPQRPQYQTSSTPTAPKANVGPRFWGMSDICLCGSSFSTYYYLFGTFEKYCKQMDMPSKTLSVKHRSRSPPRYPFLFTPHAYVVFLTLVDGSMPLSPWSFLRVW
jgi:hypothetical protein